jgi:anti-sigma factor RsiW
MTGCQHRETAAAYVLGALPEDEHEHFAAHLPGCEVCRREVAELQMVADTLPLAAP